MSNKFDNRADKLGEYWDLLNKNRQLVGSKRRGEAFGQNEWHLLANATIFNFDQEVLIQQRSFNKIGRPGEWEAETGGSVLAGEDSILAIKREVQEEIGLDLPFAASDFVASFKKWPTFDDWYVIKADIQIEQITIQKSELEQAKFVSLNEALPYFPSDHLAYITQISNNLFGGEHA